MQKSPYFRFFDFFGLRENPFAVSPDPNYLFATSEIQESWDALVYGVQSQAGIILLTGEAGTGKTTLVNRLLDWLRERRIPTAFIFNSHLEPRHLFDFMLSDFGVRPDPRWQGNALMGLSQWLPQRCREGQVPVLIVDEAQGLPLHMLEEIRLLLNLETSHQKLLQIVLVGQPELEEKLKRPEMRHLKQRITLRCKTGTLGPKETREYIELRLKIAGASGKPIFTPDAMNAVHAYSSGIPRVMNLLCEHALINAFVGNMHVVPARLVEDVAREFQFDQDARGLLLYGGIPKPMGRIDSPLVAREDSVARVPVSLPTIPTQPGAIASVANSPTAEPAPASRILEQPMLVFPSGGEEPRSVLRGDGFSGLRNSSSVAAASARVRVRKPQEKGFVRWRNIARVQLARLRIALPRMARFALVAAARELRNVIDHARARIVDGNKRQKLVATFTERVVRATRFCSSAVAKQQKSLQLLRREFGSTSRKAGEFLLRWLRQPFDSPRPITMSAQQMNPRIAVAYPREASGPWRRSLERFRPVSQLSVQFRGSAPVRRWLRQPFHLSESLRSVSRFVPRQEINGRGWDTGRMVSGSKRRK